MPRPAAPSAHPTTLAPPNATPALTRLLEAEISQHGPLDFASFMAISLYHPSLGYYARSTTQVGRQGDFFTSVSTGPLFGELLARHFAQWWLEDGQPTRWRLLETGAHDGTLALDILAALRSLSPHAYSALEYTIIEPLPLLRETQASRLVPLHPAAVRILPSAPTSEPLPGIAFGNEVIDALPFHLVECNDHQWFELRVEIDLSGKFTWVSLPPVSGSPLATVLATLPTAFPGSYRTEIRTNHASFLQPLLASLTRGRTLWIDYGFAAPEYYHPARRTGTLRTFQQHQRGDDPLASPGASDLTADVNFTQLALDSMALGARLVTFRTQASWLTQAARPWLASGETPSPQRIREFQTLVHPAHLGTRFHVLEMSWNEPAPPAPTPADLHRLALEKG